MGQLLPSGPYSLSQEGVPPAGTGTGSPGHTESSPKLRMAPLGS